VPLTHALTYAYACAVPCARFGRPACDPDPLHAVRAPGSAPGHLACDPDPLRGARARGQASGGEKLGGVIPTPGEAFGPQARRSATVEGIRAPARARACWAGWTCDFSTNLYRYHLGGPGRLFSLGTWRLALAANRQAVARSGLVIFRKHFPWRLALGAGRQAVSRRGWCPDLDL